MKVPGLLVCLITSAACGDVVITEIMYNPASGEKLPNKVEWVEVYNTGDEAVALDGWYLQDEDGKTKPMPEGTTLEPKKALVLIPAEQTVEEFRKAWGEKVPVLRMEQWGDHGILGLSNAPSETNEKLQLVDAEQNAVDEVNFDDEGDWPVDKPQGPSIYLLPGKVDAASNDDGKHWRSSKAETHGAQHAKKTETFSERDVGSPGRVTEVEASP